MPRVYPGSVHADDYRKRPMSLTEKRERRAERAQRFLLHNEENLMLRRLRKEHPDLELLDIKERNKQLQALILQTVPQRPIKLRWYIANMDEIRQEVESFQEALDYCTLITLDTRRHPTIKQVCIGFYEYTPSKGSQIGTLYIGTRENLLAQGFDGQLEEWEQIDRAGPGSPKSRPEANDEEEGRNHANTSSTYRSRAAAFHRP